LLSETSYWLPEISFCFLNSSTIGCCCYNLLQLSTSFLELWKETLYFVFLDDYYTVRNIQIYSKARSYNWQINHTVLIYMICYDDKWYAINVIQVSGNHVSLWWHWWVGIMKVCGVQGLKQIHTWYTMLL
jgi:hypothetical protein